MTPEGGYGVWRANAWITALLLGLILVVGNALARDQLKIRVDLSEDQLYAPSPVGERLVGELADLLSVRAFFTGEARLGPVQIAKRRLIEQLEELEDSAGGRIELVFVDPDASSEARAEAQALGILAWPMRGIQGTTQVTQDVHLGIVLRYRGDEVVIPFVLPQTLEYAFLSAVRKLQRDEEVTVGFLTGAGRGAPDAFTEMRALLSATYRLREVLDLEAGEPVPDDVKVLVVARPDDLHPRAVFAVDQFLQRGGRALIALDRVLVDLRAASAEALDTGFDDALKAWGVEIDELLVWDQERSNLARTTETVEVGGREQALSTVRIPYPFWPELDTSGLDPETPITARLPGADFFWIHALEVSEVPGVEHRRLAWSSPTSWKVPVAEALSLDPQKLSARAVSLLAQERAAARTLSLVVSGRLPSPFAAGAPAPFDRLRAARHAERVEAAQAEGREPPPYSSETTDEDVLSAERSTQLVVVGDADWLSDGSFFTARNKMLFANLVDWLALEDDLLELRSRVPIQRTLDDFLEEERRALGLLGARVEDDGDEAGQLVGGTVVRMEAQAERSAERRRWLFMLYSTGASLIAAVVLGVSWRLLFARMPTARPRGGAAATGGTRA